MSGLTKMNDKKLMKHLIKEVHEEGVVGEEDSILILTLKIMLRLVKNSTPTSSNVLVSDQTGGGKDFITSKLCKILLEDEVTCFHRTSMSPKVLNYWQPMINKQKVSWDGRVLYLEDPEEETIQSQAFKVMASGGTNMTVLKDQKVLNRKIEGKPVMILTSMKTTIDTEGQRRWDAIRIDDSPELTKKVVQLTCMRQAGAIPYIPDEDFRVLLRGLRSYDVTIPYAKGLWKLFGTKMVIRTQINKLFDYIKASTVLHQYQRKVDEDNKLIATEEDYELARFAYIKLRNEEGNALNKQEEILLDYLRAKGKPVKLNDITSDLEFVSKSWLYRHKDNMVEKGVVSTTMGFDPNANRDVEHLVGNGLPSTKGLPSSKKVFKVDGYYSYGNFYKEMNQERTKEGLLPIFKEVKI